MTSVIFRQDRNRDVFFIIMLALGVFFAYSFLAYASPAKFDSPDETLNYFFSQRLADGERLTAPLPPELAGQTLTYPRNAWVIQDHLVPASFLGMIQLYGWIGRLTGPSIMLFLTPFFTALAVACFFFFIKRIWGNHRALISAVLFALHPAVWYYSSRGFFHNALFVDFLIIGCWALTAATARSVQAAKRILLYSGGGIALGGALAVRTSEAFWMLAILIALVIIFRKSIDWRMGFWIGGMAFMLPLLPVLIENARLYGNPLAFGYSQGLLQAQGGVVSAPSIFETLFRFILPFGVQLAKALGNAWQYGVALFWWMSIPTVLGIVMAVQEVRQRSRATSPDDVHHVRLRRVYSWFYSLLVGWMIIYYGSWEIQDAPDSNAISIGSSYVRYWLPLFVFGVPFSASFFERLHDWLTKNHPHWRSAVAVLVSLILISLTLNSVIFDSAEGLATTRTHSVEYRMIAEETARQTPTNAVIIAGRGDKAFFPERNVIYAIENDEQTQVLQRLMSRISVYVYVPPTEALRTTEETWNNQGFELGEEITLLENNRLYKLERISNDEQQ